MSAASWWRGGKRRKGPRGEGAAEAAAPAPVGAAAPATSPFPAMPPHMRTTVLVVPRFLVHATFDAFLPYWRARVETACFWYGVRGTEGLHTATTLVLPQLYQTPGNYLVVPGTLGEVARALRAQGLTNLAQVHTHPGGWVGHSPYDDAHAYSTQDGALSLVWPHYGRALDVELSGVGVHERRDGAWVRLSPQEAAQRVRLVDAVADFRWAPNAGGIADEE